MTVDGEVFGSRGSFMELILPADATPAAQLFSSITVLAKKSPNRPPDTEARVLVTGNLDLAREGSLVLRSATITDQGKAGPYTAWCRRQHHGLHLPQSTREPSFVTAQRVVDYLRAVTRGKG